MPPLTAPSLYCFKSSVLSSRSHRETENFPWTGLAAKGGTGETNTAQVSVTSLRRGNLRVPGTPLQEHGSQRFKKPGLFPNNTPRAAKRDKLHEHRSLLVRSDDGVGADSRHNGQDIANQQGQGKICHLMREEQSPERNTSEVENPNMLFFRSGGDCNASSVFLSRTARQSCTGDSPSPKRPRLGSEACHGPDSTTLQGIRKTYPPGPPQTPRRSRHLAHTPRQQLNHDLPMSQRTPHFHATPTFTLSLATSATPTVPRISTLPAQIRTPSYFSTAITTTTTSTTSTGIPPSVNPGPRHRRFILPPSSPTKPSNHSGTSGLPPILLPDAFSPHRRKERFVPGGWAMQLRSWIVDISVTGNRPIHDGENVQWSAAQGPLTALLGAIQDSTGNSSGKNAAPQGVILKVDYGAGETGGRGEAAEPRESGSVSLVRASVVLPPPMSHTLTHNSNTIPTLFNIALVGAAGTSGLGTTMRNWPGRGYTSFSNTQRGGIGDGARTTEDAPLLARGSCVRVRSPIWEVELATADAWGCAWSSGLLSHEVVPFGKLGSGDEHGDRNEANERRKWIVCPVWTFS